MARRPSPDRVVDDSNTDHPLVTEWLRALAAANLSPETRRSYAGDLRAFLWWLGSAGRVTDLRRVGADDAAAYAEAMHDSWNRPQRGTRPPKKHLSERIRARRLIALREFYAHLVKRRLVAANPTDDITLPKLPSISHVWLTPAEVQRLRRVLPGDDRGARDRALIELGLSGYRVSEVVSLDVHDVNLDTQMVRPKWKGGDRKWHSVSEQAAEALRLWLARRPRRAKSPALFVPLPPRGADPRLTTRAVEWIFKRYLVAAGLAKARLAFHGLRHSVGQHLADQGYPLQDIQDVLRHKNPATTRIYTEASRTRLEDVYKRGVKFPT